MPFAPKKVAPIPPHVQPGARGEPRAVTRDPNSGRFFRNGPTTTTSADAKPTTTNNTSAPAPSYAYYPSGHPGARCF